MRRLHNFKNFSIYCHVEHPHFRFEVVFTAYSSSKVSVHGFKNVHCPSYREYSYSKMIEKRQGPTPGFRLREKLFKRELTDSTFFCKLPLKKFYLIYPRGFAGFLTWPLEWFHSTLKGEEQLPTMIQTCYKFKIFGCILPQSKLLKRI